MTKGSGAARSRGDVEARVQKSLPRCGQQGDRALFTQMFDRVTITAASVEIKKPPSTKPCPKSRRRIYRRYVLPPSGSRRFTAASYRRAGTIATLWAWSSDKESHPRACRGVCPWRQSLLSSTVLMNTIPAKVAGVSEIIMTSPNRRKLGNPSCRG
jgi:histidinol dehydrogenase